MTLEVDLETAEILAEIARLVAAQRDLDPGRPARALAAQIFQRFAGEDEAGARCAVRRHRVGPHGVEVRLYRPPHAPSGPTPYVVFLHGGGWSVGDLDSYDGLARSLCAASGLAVVAPGYRLAPEHPFPAALCDSLEAARWAHSEAGALGLDGGRFALAGDSAGGALAAACVPLLAPIAPKALALIYPMLDVASPDAIYPSRARYGDGRYFLTSAAIEAAALWWVGAEPALRRDPRVSPLFIPDLGGFPETLILTAALDPLADEAHAFAERLQEVGAAHAHWVRPQAIHAYLSFGVLAQARADRMALAGWLRERLSTRR